MAGQRLTRRPTRGTADPEQVDMAGTTLHSGWTIIAGLAVAAAALVAFALLAFSFERDFFVRIDDAGLRGGYTLRSDVRWLSPIMAFATTIGNTAGIIIQILLIGGWLAWRRPVGWRSSLALLVITIISAVLLYSGLKIVFGRLRPAIYPSPYALESFSFPSGHAFSATVLYGGLVFIAARQGLARGWRRPLLAGLAALATVTIGLSRIFFSVHYPTDVLGGFAAGLGWLLGLHATWHGLAWRRTRLRAHQN